MASTSSPSPPRLLAGHSARGEGRSKAPIIPQTSRSEPSSGISRFFTGSQVPEAPKATGPASRLFTPVDSSPPPKTSDSLASSANLANPAKAKASGKAAMEDFDAYFDKIMGSGGGGGPGGAGDSGAARPTIELLKQPGEGSHLTMGSGK